jgi:PAS domain-containing protein
MGEAAMSVDARPTSHARPPKPASGPHPDIPALGPLTGSWTYEVTADTWWWSEEVYAIHGFAPGEVRPTTELLTAHQHPEDLEKCRQILAHAFGHGGHFSIAHRLLDARMRTRHVLLVGTARIDDAGAVRELAGYLVDLTQQRRAEVEPAVQASLEAAARGRGVIDLAKGAIMHAHGVDADTAFAMLRSTSNESNVKVSELARRVVEALGSRTAQPATGRLIDQLLADLRP